MDKYVSEKYRESDSLEQQLSKLEEFLRKAQQMPAGSLKVKRVRQLKSELAIVRRKLSLQAGGRAAATHPASGCAFPTPGPSSSSSTSASTNLFVAASAAAADLNKRFYVMKTHTDTISGYCTRKVTLYNCTYKAPRKIRI